MYPVITRCHPLSLVVPRHHPLSPVTSRYHLLSPVVTRYYPLSPILTRRHPLSPVTTRCHLSPTVSTPFALRASHWYQTRYILLHSGEMLSWESWYGGSGGEYTLRWFVDDVELASQASQAALNADYRAISQIGSIQWDAARPRWNRWSLTQMHSFWI